MLFTISPVSYLDMSKFAVLEAEWLRQRAVTIARDTSATSFSQCLLIQGVRMIGNPSEAG